VAVPVAFFFFFVVVGRCVLEEDPVECCVPLRWTELRCVVVVEAVDFFVVLAVFVCAAPAAFRFALSASAKSRRI
jgi:hypothetical protein